MELHALVNEFDCWDYIPNPGKNVLPSTWAFKIKHYQDGRVKKFKARFCARVDRQTEGVDCFETWAPVVMWSMVCIVMVLAATLDLISVQCDITAAFIHACLPATKLYMCTNHAAFSVVTVIKFCVSRKLSTV
jgi:hypothetical protein